MKKNKVLILLITVMASISFAQKDVRLETITVKGNKEEKSYYENPGSITILQQNELPGLGRENNLQVLNAVPNVEVNKNGESFSIRGINNTGVTGFQKDNLSSIIIDDLFQTDLAIQAGSFDLWDMDHVEVLRGAQSTSQGVNSLAGTILLDHRKPQFNNEGAVKLSYGSYNHREAGVTFNSPIIEDKLAVRFSYNKEMNDGYIKNIATDNNKWGKWDKDRINGSILYKISESEKINFNAKFHRNDQGGTYSQGTNAFDYEVNEDQDYNVKTSNAQFVVGYENILSPQMTSSTTVGWSQTNQNLANDADGTANNTAGLRRENHDDHYLNFETRLRYNNGSITNLVGLHFHDFKLVDDYNFNMLFPLSSTVSTPVLVLQNVDRTQEAYAIFDSLTYRLTATQSVIAGVRGEYVQSKYGTDVLGTRTQNLGGATNTTVDNYLNSISGKYEGTKNSFVVLPQLGYTYVIDGHHMGVTYTRGYRAAGVGINRRKATAHQYEPEFTNNFETSYKYAGLNYRVGVNAFYIDWQEQQVQVQLSNDTFDTQVVNAAKSELYGAELEGSLDLTPSQKIGTGIGYTDTKFRDFQTRNADYSGKKFPFASNWTLRLSYELKATEKLTFLTVARYLNPSYSNAENTRKADAQTYVNLNAQYAIESWLLECYVNNVFDGQFRTFDGSPTSTTSPYQASYHQTGTPREMGARLNYFW